MIIRKTETHRHGPYGLWKGDNPWPDDARQWIEEEYEADPECKAFKFLRWEHATEGECEAWNLDQGWNPNDPDTDGPWAAPDDSGVAIYETKMVYRI